MLPNSRPTHVSCRCQAFSLIELLVVMVVVGVLAGIILPSLNKARLKVNAAQCMDQFRQLGTVFSKYTTDTGRLISMNESDEQKNTVWERVLKPYAGGHESWKCPDCQQGHHGVGYNHLLGEVGSVEAIRRPALTVSFGDAGIIRNPLQADPNLWVEKSAAGERGFESGVFLVPSDSNWEKSSQRMVNRHLGRASVIFADGHADSIPVSAVGFQYKSGHARSLWDNK